MTEEQLQKIKEENPIVDVAIRLGLPVKEKTGTQAISCFRHEDKHPSFVLYPDVNRFECKSCGVRGDSIDLVKEVKNSSFEEAIAFLDPSLEIKSTVITEKLTAQQYISSRGLTQETLNHFGIRIGKSGTGSEHLIIPLPTGEKYRRMVRVGQRFYQKEGTTACLFKTKEAHKKVILCEGELDAIKLWQETGYATWSGTGGAETFNESWKKDFNGIEKVFIVYDNDVAGRKGMERVISVLGEERCWKVILPSWAKDITEFFLFEEGSKETFDRLLKDAVPASFSMLEKIRKAKGTFFKITTGIEEIDRAARFESGNAYLIAGCEKSGKSALCFNIAVHLLDGGTKVSFVNTELTVKEFYERMCGAYFVKPYQQITDDEMDHWFEKFGGRLFYAGIADEASCIDEMVNFKAVMVRIVSFIERGAKVVFVDNVSTFADSVDPERRVEGWQLMARYMSRLKNLAKEKNVIVFVVNHSRDVAIERERLGKLKDIIETKNPRRIFEETVTVMNRPTNASLYGGMRTISQFSGTILLWRPFQKFSNADFNTWSLIILESFRSSPTAIEIQALFKGEIPRFEPTKDDYT